MVLDLGFGFIRIDRSSFTPLHTKLVLVSLLAVIFSCQS